MRGFSLLILLSLPALAFCVTRPVIGILTQPSSPEMSKYGESYVAASYVKYVESGGARAAVVHHNSTVEELEAAFKGLNGILFPGGGSNINGTPLEKAGQFFINASIEAYTTSGEVFPVFGHCMGFEMILSIIAGTTSVLSRVDAENLSLPLDFTSAVADSRIFSMAPDSVVNTLANSPVTMNNHMQCVSEDTFSSNEALKSFFRVISTNKDRKGKTFISTVESLNYPVYAVQWHPEKPQFEWNPKEVINHSGKAVAAMQYMSNFLVSQARLSNHAYKSMDDLNKALFYSYSPRFTEAEDPSFEQMYFF